MDVFMRAATEEARLGAAEGGIPIGSVLVHNGGILGWGHKILRHASEIAKHLPTTTVAVQ